jgi:SAM-dependent methyltransferase
VRPARLDAVGRHLSIHEVASSGFGAEADAYERARPSYPADAVDWLVDALRVPAGGRVCDLAAGTGKFTRLLIPRLPDAELMAIEPVAGMRQVLAASLPGVPVTAATAEAIPYAAATLDGITVAQAFHWFDASTALAEFHRVLRPGGRLALVWNARDRSVPWVDRIWAIMDRVEKRAPWRAHDEWRESAFVETPWFGPLTEATFHHEQVLTPADVVERVRSVSHVAVLAPERREAVLDEVRALLRDDPATAGRDELALPYRVDAYWAERT